MKLTTLLAAVVAGFCIAWVGRPAPAGAQASAGVLDVAALKAMLDNLGYENRPSGELSFEISLAREDLTIPIVVGLSSSRAKVWLTVNVGDMSGKSKADGAYLLSLLRKNGDIQPTHFFARGDNLRLGTPIDNRGLSAVALRKELDDLADHVVQTRELWENRQ